VGKKRKHLRMGFCKSAVGGKNEYRKVGGIKKEYCEKEKSG